MKLLLITLLMMMSIFPVFVDWKGQLASNYGYSLIWFITLYVTGAFLRENNILYSSYKLSILGLLGFLFASIVMFLWPRFFKLFGINSTVAMYNSFVCYSQSVCLFVAFGNLSIPQRTRKIISFLSPVILSSYLLHCQEDIEKILWDYFHPALYANSSRIILLSFEIIVLIIFISCFLETIRCLVCKKLKIEMAFKELVSWGFSRLDTLLESGREK